MLYTLPLQTAIRLKKKKKIRLGFILNNYVKIYFQKR